MLEGFALVPVLRRIILGNADAQTAGEGTGRNRRFKHAGNGGQCFTGAAQRGCVYGVGVVTLLTGVAFVDGDGFVSGIYIAECQHGGGC